VEPGLNPKNGDEDLWGLIKQSAGNWLAHKDARLGAALAYYSIFSLGPLIIIVIALAGLIFGQDVVRGEVVRTMTELLGQSGAQAIETMLDAAGSRQDGLIPTLIATGTLIFAAIGVVVQLKDALNTVWEVEPSKENGVWPFVRTYVLSIAAVTAVGFMLLVSLLLSAGLATVAEHIAIPSEGMLHSVGFLASFVVITALFAGMFKWLPDIQVAWRDVWLGAALTAALFEVGKLLIGIYIGKLGLESSFGAAASLVVILIWVYYASQILLMGAEFTRVYAMRRSAERRK
jgi:membrane protein